MPITAANLSRVLAGKAAFYKDKDQVVIKPVDPKSMGFRLMAWIVDLGNALGRNWLSSRLPLNDPESVLNALGHIARTQEEAASLKDWVPESAEQKKALVDRFQRQLPATSTPRLGLVDRFEQGQKIVAKLHNTVKNERTLYEAIQRELKMAYRHGAKIPEEFQITPELFSKQLNALPAEQLELLASHVSIEPKKATAKAASKAHSDNEADLGPIRALWVRERNKAFLSGMLDRALEKNPQAGVDRDKAFAAFPLWQAQAKARELEKAGKFRDNMELLLTDFDKALGRRPIARGAALRFIESHLLEVRTEQIGRLLQDPDLMRNAAMAKANDWVRGVLGSDALSTKEQEAWFNHFWTHTLNSPPELEAVLGEPARKSLGRDYSAARLKEAAALLRSDCEQRFNTLAAQDRGTEPLGVHLAKAARQAQQDVMGGGGLALTVKGLAQIDRLGANWQPLFGRQRLNDKDTEGLKARLASYVEQALRLTPEERTAYVLQQIKAAADELRQPSSNAQASALQPSVESAYLEQIDAPVTLDPRLEAALAGAIGRLKERGHDEQQLKELASGLRRGQHAQVTLHEDQKEQRAQLNRLSQQFESLLEEQLILASLPGLRPQDVFSKLWPQMSQTMTSLAALGAQGPGAPDLRQVGVELDKLLKAITQASTDPNQVIENARRLGALHLSRLRPAGLTAAKPTALPQGFSLYLTNLSTGIDSLRDRGSASAAAQLRSIVGLEPSAQARSGLLDSLTEAVKKARA